MDIRPSRFRPRDPGGEAEPFAGAAARPRARPPYALGVYVALTAIFAVTAFATFRFEDNPLVRRFGSNIATEALSIVVTLAFVQRLLAREERARKLRAAVGALRKGRTALASLVETWTVLTRGALDSRRTEYPRSVEHLFAPYYTEELACLDPARPPEGGGAEGDGEGWLPAAAREMAEARRRLREVIFTYGATLDSDYLEALDELADDPFVHLFLQLAGRESIDPLEWRIAVNRSRGYREAHFIRLLHAVELHNRLATEAARFRSQHLAPRAQSLNLQLESGRDLMIQTQLPPAWWSGPPAVGALRAG